jgi:ABC-type antimicrobial peptide transport system permease subunit
MKTSTLIKQSLTHYARTNVAVILGVATAVAVLAGALLTGDSVRASLKDLFLSRLGNTDFLISSTTFFREQLANDLQSSEMFQSRFTDACPIISLNGFVTDENSKRRASSIQVYGVDERFWKFHGKANAAPADRDILLSEALANDLAATAGDAILIRIEKPSAIPAGSLHGRKDETGKTIRLTLRETLPADRLGEFSLRPQQGAVRAVFVSLPRLQKDLELSGKANTILVAQDKAFTSQYADVALTEILKERFALEDLGLKLRIIENQGAIQLESDSAIINDEIARTAEKIAAASSLQSSGVLSYLANRISTAKGAIPYSLVTAIDEKRYAELANLSTAKSGISAKPVHAKTTQAPTTTDSTSGYANPFAAQGAQASDSTPILLNQWAADDLNAKIGDLVTLDYYLWQEEGRLETRSANFRVAGIVPIASAAADQNLVPDYPGISNTESLSDWNPPFPVDLKQVRPKDDEYWKKYHTTPKAFIPLAAGQQLWQSRFGKLTSIRLYPQQSANLQASLETFRAKLREELNPVWAGFVIFPVKAQGVQASAGATDFGEYFFYFSFFLVVSALLLASLFFKFGIEQRLREIGLLKAVGFSSAKIRNLFLTEGAILAFLGSLVGIVGAIFFSWLLMYGLRTWWVGAVGTNLLRLYITPTSLISGAIGGIVAALACIAWTIRTLKHSSARALLTGSTNRQSRKTQSRNRARFFSSTVGAIVFGFLGIALLALAILQKIGQTAGFFGAGICFLIALLCLQSAWLRGEKKSSISGRGFRAVSQMGFRNATYRAGRSVLCIALIASAAFIIVAVDAFKHNANDDKLDRKSGNGGYALFAESLLPLHYDPATSEGREELNITADKNFSPDMVTFMRFRVRRGEDTSCLNLYQPRNPRILGATDDFIKQGRFAFQESLAKTAEQQANPWLLLDEKLTSDAHPSDEPIPVIVDANSLTYVLHLKLGDEFALSRSDGGVTYLRVVGALSDSLFQSEFLMSEKNFLRLFKDEGGYSFFLLDTAPENQAVVTTALEERLSDYGFDVMSTTERLASFHRVENTYISTFQTLGALGLLLGTLGLATILLRNVLERRKELALLRAVGYNAEHFRLMALAENLFLLVCGLLTGTVCALLAIAPAFFARGGHLPTISLALLLFAVFIVGILASLLATASALKSPLLPALRAE